jgi:hypothetical protein
MTETQVDFIYLGGLLIQRSLTFAGRDRFEIFRDQVDVPVCQVVRRQLDHGQGV